MPLLVRSICLRIIGFAIRLNVGEHFIDTSRIGTEGVGYALAAGGEDPDGYHRVRDVIPFYPYYIKML